jgi:hypothetical protein
MQLLISTKRDNNIIMYSQMGRLLTGSNYPIAKCIGSAYKDWENP